MKYDVAVVGAGPGGTRAAFRLGRAGAKVLLLDASHPREKPCGGGVTGRALDLIGDAVRLDSVPTVTIKRARFTNGATGGDAPVAFNTNEPAQRPTLVVASRALFDDALLTAARSAGAHFHAARVRQVDRTGATFSLATADGLRWNADLVVGADGAAGAIRHQLASPFQRRQLSIATGFYAAGATSDEIVIEFVADPPGYLWSFPRPDHLAIGVCAQADAGFHPHTSRPWPRAGIRRPTSRLERHSTRYSWPIPSLSASDFSALQCAGRGWLLVGDAAGLVDPITREGIFYALQSGDMAADAIVATPATCASAYAGRLRAAVLPELIRAAELKAWFFRPHVTRLLMEAVRSSEAMRRIVADLAAGAQPYRGLRRRLAGTMEVALALRLLAAELRRAPLSGRSTRRALAPSHPGD